MQYTQSYKLSNGFTIVKFNFDTKFIFKCSKDMFDDTTLFSLTQQLEPFNNNYKI